MVSHSAQKTPFFSEIRCNDVTVPPSRSTTTANDASFTIQFSETKITISRIFFQHFPHIKERRKEEKVNYLVPLPCVVSTEKKTRKGKYNYRHVRREREQQSFRSNIVTSTHHRPPPLTGRTKEGGGRAVVGRLRRLCLLPVPRN